MGRQDRSVALSPQRPDDLVERHRPLKQVVLPPRSNPCEERNFVVVSGNRLQDGHESARRDIVGPAEERVEVELLV